VKFQAHISKIYVAARYVGFFQKPKNAQNVKNCFAKIIEKLIYVSEFLRSGLEYQII